MLSYGQQINAQITTDILVVSGGGGGGGFSVGGGGGGGAVKYFTGQSIASGTYVVTVGAGGAANSSGNLGNPGESSAFGTYVATSSSSANGAGGTGGGGGGSSSGGGGSSSAAAGASLGGPENCGCVGTSDDFRKVLIITQIFPGTLNILVVKNFLISLSFFILASEP